MSKVTFKLDKDGVADLMKSKEMQSVLESYASRVRSRVGEGYESKTKVYSRRAAVNISTTSDEARRDQLNHNTLLKALGGSR